MTDRELLELAAKAAGLPWDRWVIDGDDTWNPLTDDGDALRLAVKLHLTVRMYGGDATAQSTTPGGPSVYLSEFDAADPCAATRRAIVRAAAAIGGAP